MKKQIKSQKNREITTNQEAPSSCSSKHNLGSSSDTFKLLCPNCEEDITYIFRKGQQDVLNKVLKEIDKFGETNFSLMGCPNCKIKNINGFDKFKQKLQEELK